MRDLQKLFNPALVGCAALNGFALGGETSASGPAAQASPTIPQDASVPRYRVFDFESASDQTIVVALDAGLWADVAAQEGPFVVEGFPLERDRTVDLELERFFIARPGARIVLGRRGEATGAPSPGRLAVFRTRAVSGPVLDVPLCGTGLEQWHDTSKLPLPAGRRGSGEAPALGMQQLEIAIETDYEFFALFGDVDAAATYVIELIAAVSHIYMRYVNTRVELTFL